PSMTRVRSAVKPICASPRVAAPAAPGVSIRQRIRNQNARMDSGATVRIRRFRGMLDSGGREPILAGGEPWRWERLDDERKDRGAAQAARHRIAASGGGVGELRALYD